MKVIGYQVEKNDGSHEIHPDMEASFCVYSKTQCTDMINDQDGWTIVPIDENTIEEPTMMFSDPNTPKPIIMSNLLYDFDNFMLNSTKCTQEDREIAIELFSEFINNSIEATCLNCGVNHIIHNNEILVDDLGKHFNCISCEATSDIINL